jgi:hypothetical protein
MDELSSLLDSDDDTVTLPNGIEAEHLLFVSQSVVDGADILFVFRDEPDGDDSGWVLLAGTEPDSWLDDPDKFAEQTVAWALERDPSLIAILGAPADTSYERDRLDAEWAELEEEE